MFILFQMEACSWFVPRGCFLNNKAVADVYITGAYVVYDKYAKSIARLIEGSELLIIDRNIKGKHAGNTKDLSCLYLHKLTSCPTV